MQRLSAALQSQESSVIITLTREAQARQTLHLSIQGPVRQATAKDLFLNRKYAFWQEKNSTCLRFEVQEVGIILIATVLGPHGVSSLPLDLDGLAA